MRVGFDYEDALKVLEPRTFGVKPDMSRITALTDLLDHPERTYPTIHIAGTNGKSTTARMIGAILAAHGVAAGVYTSPHLQSVRERFLSVGPAGSGEIGEEYGGMPAAYITKEEFANTLGYLLPYVDLVERDLGDNCTYFELTTVIAFEWMAQAVVGAGIFEAGMGGLWDSTNVILSDVAALTHIAVDHQAFLGSTPIENAKEKVGIIKSGSSVISSFQDEDVMRLIEETALARGGELAVLGRDFAVHRDDLAVGGRAVDIEGTLGFYSELLVPLHGRHQSFNAAMAIAVCEQFTGRTLDGDLVRSGLATVVSPGRLEIVRREPLVVLDGAHNPDGAKNLGSALIETFGEKRRMFVISISQKKDTEGILRELLPLAEKVFFTQHQRDAELTEGGEDPARLGESPSAKGVNAQFIPSLPDAVDAAIAAAGTQDLVVVTGSLYAAGEARDHLLGALD